MINVLEDENIPRKAVQSSLFKSVGYDEKEQLLQVEFKNGDVYNYSDITQEMYQALSSAESIGKYYLANIKGKFNANKI